MRLLSSLLVALLLFFGSFDSGCRFSKRTSFSDKVTRRILLARSASWMYQIQGLDSGGAISKLARTDYPLLVLDPARTVKGSENFDTKSMISRLRKRPNNKKRLILAYVDIGEAEDYRIYWKNDWRAPEANKAGDPDFIVRRDPDGWEGNYPVAFWDKRWKDIWLGSKGIVNSLAKDGFDGLYLDWVEAYEDEEIAKVADRKGLNPAKEMVKFIQEIKAAGRKSTPGFLIITQNAPYLLDSEPNYYKAIDGLAVEGTWFSGQADAVWGDPNGGDIINQNKDDYSTSALLKQYKKYLRLKVPVFSVDYCLSKSNAQKVYMEARKVGLRPLVTQVSLANNTQTPPKGSFIKAF